MRITSGIAFAAAKAYREVEATALGGARRVEGEHMVERHRDDQERREMKAVSATQTALGPTRPQATRAATVAAIGALAVGVTAFGAMAIGRLAIGALALRRGHVRTLRVDDLDVSRLHIREVVIDRITE